MSDKVDRDGAVKQAEKLFADQYHCAETVVKVSLQALGEDPREALVHATPFGGGFGRSFSETCGVVSGSLIVIGHLYGRRGPGEPWDVAEEIAAAVREKFLLRNKETSCKTLYERFGQEKEVQLAECRKLVCNGVSDLLEFLQSDECRAIIERGDDPKKKENQEQR
jgi:C_GCAxxG_C_C family probable redox protein